jgi:putative ABC transport system ATP-binding protein
LRPWGASVMSGLLRVLGVSKGYSRGGWTGVLEGVSLDVGPGEIVAVVGSRFTGKTTLLQIAAGIERPDKGQVFFDGRELGALRARQRTGLLGHEILWMNRGGPAPDGLEVARWVGWSLALHGSGGRQAERAAEAALAGVGASECAGRKWDELSHWQQALVCCARVWAARPRLLVVDDLFDALGQTRTEEAADLLRSIVEESAPRCGVLMSVTESRAAMFADRIWTFTGRRGLKLMAGIAEDHDPGEPAEVIQLDARRGGEGSRSVGA